MHVENDNMWVANISPFNIAVTPGIGIRIVQSGQLEDPSWGSWRPFPTVGPPPGENIVLSLIDTQGNRLVYLFQRAPEYIEHSLRMDIEYPWVFGIRGYREIFLGAHNAEGGEYVDRGAEDDDRRSLDLAVQAVGREGDWLGCQQGWNDEAHRLVREHWPACCAVTGYLFEHPNEQMPGSLVAQFVNESR